MNTERLEINGELILVTPGWEALPIGTNGCEVYFLGEDAILVLGIDEYLTFGANQQRITRVFSAVAVSPDPVDANHDTLIFDRTRLKQRAPLRSACSRPVGHKNEQVVAVLLIP